MNNLATANSETEMNAAVRTRTIRIIRNFVVGNSCNRADLNWPNIVRTGQLFRSFAEDTIAAICPTVTNSEIPSAISKDSSNVPKIATYIVNSIE